MRVLYCTINRKTFGTARVLLEWLTLGTERGIEPSVVTMARDDLCAWCDERGIPSTTAPLQPTNKTMRGALHNEWHVRRVTRFARRQRVELVHCNEHNCYPFAARVARSLGVPIVCHMRYLPERVWVQWAMSGERHPDAVLWTSRTQQTNASGSVDGLIDPAAQHVVYLGLDPQRFGNATSTRAATRAEWGFSPDDVVIGYSAVPQPRKRVEDVLGLVQQLHAENPRVAGVIAGHCRPEFEDYTRQLRARIDASGLGDRFQWLGRVDPIEPMLQAIDLFVSTSTYETFGMGVLEAMMCRRPVLVYEGGSLSEVVGDAGVVIPNEDTQRLLQEARGLVNAPRRRAELGEAGRRRVEQAFNPSRSMDQLMDIYKRCLTARGVV